MTKEKYPWKKITAEIYKQNVAVELVYNSFPFLHRKSLTALDETIILNGFNTWQRYLLKQNKQKNLDDFTLVRLLQCCPKLFLSKWTFSNFDFKYKCYFPLCPHCYFDKLYKYYKRLTYLATYTIVVWELPFQDVNLGKSLIQQVIKPGRTKLRRFFKNQKIYFSGTRVFAQNSEFKFCFKTMLITTGAISVFYNKLRQLNLPGNLYTEYVPTAKAAFLPLRYQNFCNLLEWNEVSGLANLQLAFYDRGCKKGRWKKENNLCEPSRSASLLTTTITTNNE